MEAKRGIAPLGGAHPAPAGETRCTICSSATNSMPRAPTRSASVQEVVGIAPTIAKNAPLWIQVTKEAALTYIEAGERAAIDYIPKVREQVLNSQDMLEGLQSLVERRAAVFKGR
jgi:enoyl-CoA hydratase